MQTTHHKKTSQISTKMRKFLSLTAAAAFIATPLFGAVTQSEAAPPHRGQTAHRPNHKPRPNPKPRPRPRPRPKPLPKPRPQPRRDNRHNPRNNRYNRFQEFYGSVTKVKGRRDFDIRANGRIYNVTTSGVIPGNLRRNDQVRVQGVRFGNNDIIDARIVVLHRR